MESFIIQPYDLLMLGVLVGLAVLGAWKGVAWQVAALSSLVISWIVAVRFGKVLAPLISDNEPWNGFIAMLLLYLGTSLAIWSFFRLVKGAIDRVQLKDFDRQMGALFGLVKGVLWCLLITFFAVTLSETTRQWVLQSKSGYYTAQLIQNGAPMLPEDVRNVLDKYIRQLDAGLEEGDTGQLVDSPVSDLLRESGDLAPEFDVPESKTVTDLRDDSRGYLNSQATEARGYFDSRASDARGNLNSQATEAGGYFDSRASDTRGYLNSQASDARGYVDSRASEARGYLDSRVNEARSYLDSRASESRNYINSRASELERGIDEKAERVDSGIREAMRRGLDELDSQVKRRPLEPVDR